jgi:hypothetical protein
MQGFERGLYNNASITINAQCLADDSANNAVTIYDDYMDGGSFNKMLLAGYEIQYSFQRYCGIQDVLFDLVTWFAAGEYDVDVFSGNVLKKLFFITGDLNNIGEIFYTTTLPATSNANAYFTLYSTVGQNIGNIFYIILGFSPLHV